MMMRHKDGREWSGAEYDKKADAHFAHAGTLRKQAEKLRAAGNDESADAIERKARDLRRTACDWLERSLELTSGIVRPQIP
jgi:hypothetical protein